MKLKLKDGFFEEDEELVMDENSDEDDGEIDLDQDEDDDEENIMEDGS